MQKSARSKLYENYDYLSPESQSRIQQSGVLRQPDVIRKGLADGNLALHKKYGIANYSANPLTAPEFREEYLKSKPLIGAAENTLEHQGGSRMKNRLGLGYEKERFTSTPNLSNKYIRRVYTTGMAIHNPRNIKNIIKDVPKAQHLLDRHEVYEAIDPKANVGVYGTRADEFLNNPKNLRETELRKLTKNEQVKNAFRAYKKDPSMVNRNTILEKAAPDIQRQAASFNKDPGPKGVILNKGKTVGNHNSLGVLGKERKTMEGFSYLPETRLVKQVRDTTGENTLIQAVTGKGSNQSLTRKDIRTLEKAKPSTFKGGLLAATPQSSSLHPIGTAFGGAGGLTPGSSAWDVGKAKATLQTTNPPKPSYVGTALNKIKPVFGGLGRVKRLFGH